MSFLWTQILPLAVIVRVGPFESESARMMSRLLSEAPPSASRRLPEVLRCATILLILLPLLLLLLLLLLLRLLLLLD